ncbi:hypothetical protein [Microbacterium amylolyticum]|uniref:Uncharacterized protein n=1 Tax=Microbacterium amylolyticum TaxID=936337 RepID=A0ABS4ZIM0_9MICO|nr:hypothetical protein [Microbacterium amylolyticum]MBP2437122.1 hypothetical protein [Microbacterium amylolyticum]
MRWSEYVSLDEELATLDWWWDVVDRAAPDHPEIRDITPCMGELDAVTAEALRDVMDDVELSALRWKGYSENPSTTLMVPWLSADEHTAGRSRPRPREHEA